MGKYRVCVYAICKNEENFVRRWMESMTEADEIYVLDTGSSDGTVGLLEELGAQVTVEEIKPWRFDIARNRSLDLVPQDADICVCTDLDKILRPGWREKVEEAWRPDAFRLHYRYTWNYLPDGREGIVFWTDKIHCRQGCRWVNPVHEVLTFDGGEGAPIYAEGVFLEHHADPAKSRGQYLPLLELAVEEDPTNDRNTHYLGREYYFHGRWAESEAMLKRHLALLACQRENWLEVLYCTGRALAIQERPKSYMTEPAAWGGGPWDLASLAYYYLGQRALAIHAVKTALTFAPEDPRLVENLRLMETTMAQYKENSPPEGREDLPAGVYQGERKEWVIRG